jgi:hypothetical protein
MLFSSSLVAYRQITGAFSAALPAGTQLELRTGTIPTADGAHNVGTVVGAQSGGLPATPWSQSGRKLSNAAAWSIGVTTAGTPTWFSLRPAADDGSGAGTAANKYRVCGTVGQLGAPKTITAGAVNGANYDFTAAAHGYAVGDQVYISGHGVAALNGLQKVTAVGGVNAFSVANPSGNAATSNVGNAQSAPFDLNLSNTTLQFGDAAVIAIAGLALSE